MAMTIETSTNARCTSKH